MNAVLGIAIASLAATMSSTLCIDLFGTGTAWIGVVTAALTSAWWCSTAGAAAVCSGLAIGAMELLAMWPQADRDLTQLGAHVATAALLAAAFSLTRRTAADNSATSQAQETASEGQAESDEVNDED